MGGSPGDEFDRGLIGAIDAGIDAGVEWVKETASDAWNFVTGNDEAPSDPNASAGGGAPYSTGGGSGGADGGYVDGGADESGVSEETL
jgi:hypothetical protein